VAPLPVQQLPLATVGCESKCKPVMEGRQLVHGSCSRGMVGGTAYQTARTCEHSACRARAAYPSRCGIPTYSPAALEASTRLLAYARVMQLASVMGAPPLCARTAVAACLFAMATARLPGVPRASIVCAYARSACRTGEERKGISGLHTHHYHTPTNGTHGPHIHADPWRERFVHKSSPTYTRFRHSDMAHEVSTQGHS